MNDPRNEVLAPGIVAILLSCPRGRWVGSHYHLVSCFLSGGGSVLVKSKRFRDTADRVRLIFVSETIKRLFTVHICLSDFTLSILTPRTSADDETGD